MLMNGLAKILIAESKGVTRFADLFVGSGAVAWHVAENIQCQVLANDLQSFAVSLAEAVITRREPADPSDVWDRWQRNALRAAKQNRLFSKAEHFHGVTWEAARRRSVNLARLMCAEGAGPITRAYGGHYYSPQQALLLDAYRQTLPDKLADARICLGALIWAASQCAAAPGHTAQPFQPTKKAASFLFDAWRRDIGVYLKAALDRICPKHAKLPGEATVCDAETLASQLNHRDLAFIDPPYSGVHYSRFYHVLETVARGRCGSIAGVGRYPTPAERPKSDFSVKSRSNEALDTLLEILANNGTKAILTFPCEETSNGLSGTAVEAVAKKYFYLRKTVVNGRFSTLGGRPTDRKARVPAYELILVLSPR